MSIIDSATKPTRGAKVEKPCELCGAPMLVRVADVERGWGRFCSKRCAGKNSALTTNMNEQGSYPPPPATLRVSKPKGEHRAFLMDEHGLRVATVAHNRGKSNASANARRLSAAWNAVNGISTLALEQNPALLGELLAATEYLLEVTEPPERDCRCHTNPPCGDCVEYGGLREAREVTSAIVSTLKGVAL